ncbi:UNVERIFIED_CONTAM: hypothetical protein FKN15_027072 [Acipenser sinensis]
MEKTLACDSSLALDIENRGLIVVRETSKKSDRCWKRISLVSFLLLTAATFVLAMMYFGVIPSKIEQTNRVASTTQESFTEKVIENMPAQLKQVSDKKDARKPAAHLIAADLSKDHTKLSWLSNANQAFLENGMRLENEQELVIPAEGLYFIYAQVVFRGKGSSEGKGASDLSNGCSGRGSSTNILSLSVERWSDAYPMYESILSTSRSLCLQRNQGGVWTVPLYQGALFKLNKGDKLKVKASPLTLINDSKTFFGAFAI